MYQTNILIAESSYLLGEGLKSLIDQEPGFVVSGWTKHRDELAIKIKESNPAILTIDPANPDFGFESIDIALASQLKVIVMSRVLEKQAILKAVESKVHSYLLQDCSQEEIAEALHATQRGDRFFCGKVLDLILDQDRSHAPLNPNLDNCLPVSLSNREIEIIQFIAKSYTNREIAEKLFLSTHTINTHRKNIMQKLEIRNTAGLVLYAIKEKLVASM